MNTDIPQNIRCLHTWTVELEKEVDETITETRDGQEVKVTRKVKKLVATRFALKQPTRRELKTAELFYGTEFNRFITMGFLPRSIMVNKHLDLTGGVLSGKERDHVAKLVTRHSELEKDLIRALNEPEEVRTKIQAEIAGIRTEISNLNAANESVFSQTAEVKTQNQLAQWFSFYLIHIERNSKWEPYFEGDTFEKKEESMWKLEEANDELYIAAANKMATYIHFYNMGASKPEQFKIIDEELKKQFDAKKKATKDAAAVKDDTLAADAITPIVAAGPAG
jgi:hypothetical protein